MSHFDSIIGPKVIKTVGDEISHNHLNEILQYIDYHEKGYFIHEFGEIKSANIIFFVESPIARGNTEKIMISAILIHDDMDPRSYYNLLELFITKFKQIKDVYKGLHLTKDNISMTQEYSIRMEAIMNDIYNRFPLESIIIGKSLI